MNLRRVVAPAVVAAAAFSLAGCGLVTIYDGDEPAEPEPSASESPAVPSDEVRADPDASYPEIVVLAEDQVTDGIEFTQSEPAGTWKVGPGVPLGFPAGIPVFPDRWIDREARSYTTSDGKRAYSAMFWGDYDDVAQIVEKARELGFDIAEQRDDQKWVIAMENDRYKFIINAAEVVEDVVDGGILDPAYSYTVVYNYN